jgi:NADP-dependent 3-hydroxy acid dehydrogenase YdfG
MIDAAAAAARLPASTYGHENLFGVWRCLRAALPHMLEGGYGRQLVTASVAGTWQSWAEHADYTPHPRPVSSAW